MNTRSFLTALLPAVLVAGFASSARAVETSALTPEQAAEVRNLVKEVLADSGQRATMADGMYAGIDNKGKVFIKSEDGKYLMNISGKVQVRYTYNNAVNAGTGAATAAQTASNSGFEVRRLDLDFTGKLGDGVGYVVEFENRIGDSATANAALGIQKAYGIIELSDGVSVQAGKFYLPYTREALMSSGAQTAAERSALNNHFNLGTAEGAQINWHDDSNFNVMAALSNGANSNGVKWNAAPARFAASARAEWLVLGSFADVKDNAALADADKQELAFGLAGYYESLDKNGAKTTTENSTTNAIANGTAVADNAYGANIDAIYKVGGLSFYGAANIAGATPAGNTAGLTHPTPWGLEGQVDWRFVKNMDAFVQYSYINSDVNHTANNFKDLHEVTVGANYYINSRTKLTGDVTWIVSGDAPVKTSEIGNGALSDGAGFAPGNGQRLDGQVAARLQLQVSF